MTHLNFWLTQIRSYILMALAVSFFLGINVLSCQKPTRSESTVLITGTIENPKEDTIFFWIELEDTVIGAPIIEGVFTVLIPVREPSFGRLFLGNENTWIYLTPNKDIDLSLNTEEFDETLKYTGAGAEPNNYLIAKFLLKEKEAWKREYLGKKESEFVDIMNERQAKRIHQLNLYSSAENLPAGFIEIQKSEIDLTKSNILMSYARKRNFGDPEFYISEDFYSFVDDIDLNNEVLVSVPNFIFGSHLLERAKHHYRFLDNDSPDLMQIMHFFESRITNRKVLDYALWVVMYRVFADGAVDEEEIEIMKLFHEKCKNSRRISWVKDKYAKTKQSKLKSDKLESLRGKPAPIFEYADIKGNKVALKDLKGSVVYIDIWATWCAPCLKELPALEKLQHKFKNDKVSFVSISVDKHKSTWEKMVAKKDMKGIQLISDKAFDSSICKDYLIAGIPRFILIDHNGNLVDSNAPRPSSDDIEPLLKEVLAKI